MKEIIVCFVPNVVIRVGSYKVHASSQAVEDLKLLNACAACGAPDASRACQGCRSATGISTVRYSNPSCQKTHRKAHEPDCGPCQCHRCK
jgi:hypothetical protein